MQNATLKTEIKEYYGRIARVSGSCCSPGSGCGTSQGVPQDGEGMPYDGRDPSVLAAADLGLGCGDPTRFSGLAKGMTVLDLGSGAGIDVFLAAKEIGPEGRAIGLDMTDEMLERAEKNRETLGLRNTTFIKGEIESIPLPSNSVDRVISNCVINLVPDKEKAFLEVHRVLKPGGTFVISDIVTEGTVPDEVRNDPAQWSGCVAGAVDRDQYLETINRAGFVEVRFLSQTDSSPVPDQQFEILSVTVTGKKEEGS